MIISNDEYKKEASIIETSRARLTLSTGEIYTIYEDSGTLYLVTLSAGIIFIIPIAVNKIGIEIHKLT